MEHIKLTGQSSSPPKSQSILNKGKFLPNLGSVKTIYKQSLTAFLNLSIPALSLKLKAKFRPKPLAEDVIINSPFEAYLALDAIYQTLNEDQEHFIILCLRSGGRCVGYKLIASGGSDYVMPDKTIIFRYAFNYGACELVLAHNHPAGGLNPSPNNLALTEDLINGGQLIGIPIMDHLIYTTQGYTSIRSKYQYLFEIS